MEYESVAQLNAEEECLGKDVKFAAVKAIFGSNCLVIGLCKY